MSSVWSSPVVQRLVFSLFAFGLAFAVFLWMSGPPAWIEEGPRVPARVVTIAKECYRPQSTPIMRRTITLEYADAKGVVRQVKDSILCEGVELGSTVNIAVDPEDPTRAKIVFR